MKKCVFCGREFKELSEEHIFPNVICGRLKSKNLLCTDCNSWLGENIDIAFDGVYSHIIHLFKIKRERGEGQPIIVKGVEDDTEYRFSNDGTYELAHVECKTEKGKEKGFELKIEAPVDKRRLKSAVGKELAQRKDEIAELGLDYKQLIKETQKNIDNGWENILTRTKEFKPNALNFRCCLGGKNVALAVLKIAFLYSKHVNPKIKIDDETIVQILKNQSEEVFDRCLFFNLENDLFEEIPDEISHHILVKGDSGKIIAYIKLFSVTPYVCILNDNYIGADFEFSYGYNLLNGNTFKPKCHPIKDLSHLKETLEYEKNFNIACQNIKKDYSRIMELYYQINPTAKKCDIQTGVEKHLRTLLSSDLIDTPFFQNLISFLGEKQYYFTNKLSEQEKGNVIHNISMILLKHAIMEAQKYNHEFK